jgi:hypothetical protein
VKVSKKAESPIQDNRIAVHSKVSDVLWEKHSAKSFVQAACYLRSWPLQQTFLPAEKRPEQHLTDSGSFVNIETLAKKLTTFALHSSLRTLPGSVDWNHSDAHHYPDSLQHPRHLCMISDKSRPNMPAGRETIRRNELIE